MATPTTPHLERSLGDWSRKRLPFGAPLFLGFMYASVGSYIARVIRIFDLRFAPYPPFWTTVVLAVAIYVNFFAHPFLPDIRYVLFAATVVMSARTRIWFCISHRDWWMPLPMAAFLASLALWVAKTVGTATGTRIHASQRPDHLVSPAKIGSWYLLLYVAFVTVTVMVRSVIARNGFFGQICPFVCRTITITTPRINNPNATVAATLITSPFIRPPGLTVARWRTQTS